MNAKVEMVGQKFGRLTVASEAAKRSPDGKTHYHCVCECGATTVVRGNALRTGNTTSCGCERGNAARARFLTHGMSETRLYRIWTGMLSRCSDQQDERYGKRGIKVCPRWAESFEAFRADMGDPPSTKHSIDRKDNDGDYEPGNCRWATAVDQQRNTSRNRILTMAGETMTMVEWSNRTGIKQSTICLRLAKGWSVDRALTEPVTPNGKGKP